VGSKVVVGIEMLVWDLSSIENKTFYFFPEGPLFGKVPLPCAKRRHSCGAWFPNVLHEETKISERWAG